MTDKVRIDTLRADLLDANNETFLARQAEFESNVRSYPRKLPLAITKAEGVWLTDADNKQYLDCLAGAGTLALGHNHPDVLQSIQSVITSGLPLHTLDRSWRSKVRCHHSGRMGNSGIESGNCNQTVLFNSISSG